MLTQLQLEGPELEPLLARVRTELGPHARIVHAEKIRSGGVAGFFAHQRFEITVEVDTSLPRTSAPPVRTPAVLPVPPTSPEQPSPVPAPQPSPPPAPAFSAIAGLGEDEREPSLFTGLAASITAVPTRSAAAAAQAYAVPTNPPQVPQPRDELPSVLAAALQGRPTAPPPPPRAPLPEPVVEVRAAGFEPYAPYAGAVPDGRADAGPVRATPADTAVPPSSVLELADRVSAQEADALVSTESSSFAALLSRLGDDIGALGDDEPDLAPEPTAGGRAVAGDDSPVVQPTPEQDGAVVAVRPPAEVVVHDPAAAGPAAELARLGLPSHLRPDGVGEALHTALRASLSRLPTAPPAMNRAGGVLAVVGPLTQALHVAREIAAELGLPAATSVAVATAGPAGPDVADRQVLHGTAEAAERRSTWRRRSNLTVVVVDAPLTANGAAEARAFLAALSPTATWGVVEATRKAQDVGSWTRALGGVHALALTELEETSDPAAVLELGIPVSRLGGRPATPRAWATLLTGRLAA